MCISWTIKCLILLMHGATMKLNKYHILLPLNTLTVSDIAMS